MSVIGWSPGLPFGIVFFGVNGLPQANGSRFDFKVEVECHDAFGSLLAACWQHALVYANGLNLLIDGQPSR